MYGLRKYFGGSKSEFGNAVKPVHTLIQVV
jgi:hypothetical protein